MLAVAAGLVPCHLTMFLMTYGMVFAGIALSFAFADGMICTVACFPLLAAIAGTLNHCSLQNGVPFMDMLPRAPKRQRARCEVLRNPGSTAARKSTLVKSDNRRPVVLSHTRINQQRWVGTMTEVSDS